MASHTFCRAKPLTQQPCRASDALAIVQDLLSNGAASLVDDVRANIYSLELALEVLTRFPEDIVEGGAAEEQPAATTTDAGVAVPGTAAPTTKKDRKKERKSKEAKEGGLPLTSGKDKKDKGSSRKRTAEGGEAEEEGKEKRKKKKQKTEP